MKIAICEDEIEFQYVIKKEVEKFYGALETDVEVFSSGEELLEKCNKAPEEFEIIFMDIEMPGINGVETSKKIREFDKNVLIIFLTSHVEMATDGYEVEAFRFLVKPIQENKLFKALTDIEKLRQLNKKIEFYDGEKTIIINYTDIQYVRSENVYINIFTDKRKYLVRKKLSDIWEQLSSEIFYKPHRSYIINMGFVQSFDGKKIIMKSGEEVPISRGKSSEFKNTMMKYLSKLG